MAKKKSLGSFDRKGQFFRTYKEIFESNAFRSLDCNARCLLHELHALYIPSRNEDVFLSTRDSARRLGIHPDTARKAFYALEAKGFIKLTRGGLWQQRLAREWRLTFESYRNREPSDEWAQYHEPNTEPKPRGSLPQSEGQSGLKKLAEVEE